MNEEIEKVGIAERRIVVSPKILSCLGLGSCVSVCFYDPKIKLGGLAHILLPDSQQAKDENFNPAKYADTAIKLILDEMMQQGAEKRRMWAKIVGGASMFKNGSLNAMFTVGERNVAAVRDVLGQEGIKIAAEDVGGNAGRSLEFYTDSGKVYVRSKINCREI